MTIGRVAVRAAMLLFLAGSVAFSFPSSGRAADATPTDRDPIAQSRAVKLAEELRCLVCQNQTIADSNADLAVDLRRQVREQIDAGRSDREIIDYMTARYGDFVLYRPPFKTATLLLWAGPALLLAIGALMLVRLVRERRKLPLPDLSPEERARAASLLDSHDRTGSA